MPRWTRKMCELFTRLYLGGEQCGCGEQMMAGLFDAFPAFSRMGARRLPRTLRALEAWRRLTPSRCWAAICWRLVERGHVQMALYVLLVFTLLEALDSAGNTTMRSGETCDKRLRLLGNATASPGRSQAKQNPTTRRGLPLGLPVPEWDGRSLFLALSGVHDPPDQCGMSRAHRWPNAVQ